jgi:hypothetical protein
MPLNDLSLDELNEMADTAATLCRVGNDLVNSGLTPVFDLSPGQAVTIRLDAVMPEAPGQATKEDVDATFARIDALNARVDAHMEKQIARHDAQDAAPRIGTGMMDFIKKAVAGEYDYLPTYTPKFSKSTDALPPRDWPEGEEHQVAEIYARNRIQTPYYDPSYEASKATGRRVVDVRAYVTAHLYPLCDQHLERLRSETPSTEAALSEPAPEPVEVPPADEGPAGGDPQSSAVPSSAVAVALPPPGATEAPPPPQAAEAAAVGAAEDSGGGQQAAAAPSPAAPAAQTEDRAPVPGSASALAASAAAVRNNAWTPEEDARLIEVVVMGMQRLGLGKYAAIRAAAEELGRPVPGTEFRCKNALRARLEDALAAAPPSPEAAPVADGDTAAEGATPAAVQADNGSFVADPVTAHLMALTDKGGWTLDRDLELMELSIAGWAPNEIALQIQMQAGAIKPRFDALTGLYTDGNDKKQRRFSREAVFEALTRLAGKAA